MTVPQAVRHTVPEALLRDTRDFLFERGLGGCEGMALWVGEPDGDKVKLSRLLVPEQICTRTEFGVAVDMTERAHLTLLDHVAPHERLYVRVHSHPGRAYHSERDDENLVLTHHGALSVVVPDFARQPLNLDHCAVYRLHQGRGWLRLTPNELARVFEVVP